LKLLKLSPKSSIIGLNYRKVGKSREVPKHSNRCLNTLSKLSKQKHAIQSAWMQHTIMLIANCIFIVESFQNAFRRRLGSLWIFFVEINPIFGSFQRYFHELQNILFWFLVAQGISRMFLDFFSLEDIFSV
jgi:hypothetical protein